MRGGNADAEGGRVAGCAAVRFCGEEEKLLGFMGKLGLTI